MTKDLDYWRSEALYWQKKSMKQWEMIAKIQEAIKNWRTVSLTTLEVRLEEIEEIFKGAKK